MTVEERTKVEALALLLWPGERYKGHCSDGPNCDFCDEVKQEWNARLWQLYEALMKVGLI